MPPVRSVLVVCSHPVCFERGGILCADCREAYCADHHIHTHAHIARDRR